MVRQKSTLERPCWFHSSRGSGRYGGSKRLWSAAFVVLLSAAQVLLLAMGMAALGKTQSPLIMQRILRYLLMPFLSFAICWRLSALWASPRDALFLCVEGQRDNILRVFGANAIALAAFANFIVVANPVWREAREDILLMLWKLPSLAIMFVLYWGFLSGCLAAMFGRTWFTFFLAWGTTTIITSTAALSAWGAHGVSAPDFLLLLLVPAVFLWAILRVGSVIPAAMSYVLLRTFWEQLPLNHWGADPGKQILAAAALLISMGIVVAVLVLTGLRSPFSTQGASDRAEGGTGHHR